jgi:predicted dehydrogenase
MFIAGVTNVADPPLNDLWTIPGEEHLLEQWQQADRATFAAGNITQHYFNAQVEDFLQAILDDRDPLITGEQGRVTVEIFSAIYQSQRDRRPIRFPVASDV